MEDPWGLKLENAKFYKTLNNISTFSRSHDFFNIDFHVDIHMKTPIYLFLPISCISLVKHLSQLDSSGDPLFLW